MFILHRILHAKVTVFAKESVVEGKVECEFGFLCFELNDVKKTDSPR